MDAVSHFFHSVPLDFIIIQTINGLVAGMILALVASGLTLIFGSSIMARAIASICCSPPDSVPPAWLRRSPSTGK